MKTFFHTLGWVLLVVLALANSQILAAHGAEPATTTPKTTSGTPLKFDSTGAMAGEQLPDLMLRTLEDEPQQLSDAWYSQPALLLASSFTCPKSRSRWPDAKEIAKNYSDKLNVLIIYVIEAHPVGDVCPYKG